MISDILISMTAGFIFGAGYTFLGLPLPAPQSLAGVLGILGVWLGFVGMTWLRSL